MQIRGLRRAVMIYGAGLAALGVAQASAAASGLSAGITSAGVLGDYTIADSARNVDQGLGGTLFVSLPVTSTLNLEPTLFGESLRRAGGSADSAYGLGADLRWLLPGAVATHGIQPFLIGGVGVEYDHSSVAGGGSAVAPYLNAGAGVAVPLSRGVSLRADARNYAVLGTDAYPGSHVLDDWRLRLGIEYHFGPTVTAAVLPKPGAAAGTYADSHFGSPEPPHANPTPKEAACCAVVPTTNEQPTAMVPDSAAIRSASSAGLSSTPDISVEPAMPAAAPTAPTAMDRLCPPPPQGFAVDSHGCLTEQIATIPEVRFAPNTSRLTAEAVQILTQFAEALVQQPQFFVEVDGNTDSSGSQYANLELSRQRAKAVKDTLIAHGVAAQRLSAEGYGSFRPLTNNATEQEREQNRRIDFRITAAP